MSRHVSVVVPHERADGISHILYNFPHAFKIVRFNTFTSVHLSFKVNPKHLQEVIVRLGAAGCGDSYGTIDVFSCLLTRPLLQVKVAGEENKTPKYSVSDRLTVDEIEDIVEDGNHLTFDYMAQIAVASVIAGVGLITDSATVVIAAMLVSPLMGPILSLTFGIAVVKKSIVSRGMRNEVIGVIISVVVGSLCGFAQYGISGLDFNPGDAMLDRGSVRGLVAGSVVAAASGMGVILALSKGGVNAIVGTSISASLLPPCVNTGICTAYVICINLFAHDSSDLSKYEQTAVVSFLLYMVNFVLIVLVGIWTLRYIKKIYPHDDPRNLPNNPHLNIPRALMSEDGGSVSTSSDMGSGTGRRGGGTEKTLDGLDALESAVGPGEIRHPFPFLSDPDGASTRKVHSSSLFSYSSSTDQDTMERPLLTGAESQSYSHSQSRHSSPRVATDRRTLSDFSVENTVDSPQVLSQRKHISSNEIEDVSEL